MDRRTVLGTVLGLGAAALTAKAAYAETAKPDGTLPSDPVETLALWPATPPGGEGVGLTTRIVERSTDPAVINDRYVDSVGVPLLTVFRPAKPDGSAVLLAPGGGYVRIVMDKEGFESARRFNQSGVTVFVLRYRLPGEGWNNRADVPLQDAQRAIRLIRSQAAAYGIDASRVGVLGFSAGGHVAASLATRFAEKVYAPVDAADQIEARPAFAGLMYPVITMTDTAHGGSRKTLLGEQPSPQAIAHYSAEQRVTAATPPCFVCCALDDATVPPIGNAFAMALALNAAKIPVELHAFQEGGHGFGIHGAQGKPCAAWPDLFVAWASRNGWIGAKV